jgi:hypothetical protein
MRGSISGAHRPGRTGAVAAGHNARWVGALVPWLWGTGARSGGHTGAVAAGYSRPLGGRADGRHGVDARDRQPPALDSLLERKPNVDPGGEPKLTARICSASALILPSVLSTLLAAPDREVLDVVRGAGR